MSSVFLPCPSCSAPLILDEENAGQEVLCPGCGVHLKLPATVSTDVPPVVVTEVEMDAPKTAASGKKPGKAALPQSRSKSVEEERKRLAAAAAAAGGAHSFQPGEAVLPTDHRPVALPAKRTLPLAPVETSSLGEEGEAPSRPAVKLPDKRNNVASPDSRSGPVPIQPLEPKEDVTISGTSLTGPSKFVRSNPPLSRPAAPEAASPDVQEDADDAVEKQGPVPRGGYRLGGSRQLHFSPAPTVEGDGEAADWGTKVESAAQAARGRRFVSLAILIAVLAAGGVGFHMFRQAMAQKEQLAQPLDDGPTLTARSGEDVMRNVEDARRVLKRFLEAETVEQMATEVRHPEITQPRMERYYADNPIKPRKIKSESQSWSEFRVENTEFIRGVIELDDFRVRPVSLEIIEGSDPKVDWESYVHWAEIPWKDFLRSPPEQSVDYRVTVTLDPRDQYYNYSFKGRELDLLCFKLEDPEKYASCWGYCDKDSETASKLLFNLKRSRQEGFVNPEGKIMTSCILRLRFPPEGMKTNQVMIEKFVHDNWVVP